LYTTAFLLFPKKPYTLAVFEPRSSVPEADTMSTAPCRQGLSYESYYLGTTFGTFQFSWSKKHLFYSYAQLSSVNNLLHCSEINNAFLHF
jgi:hypothetical protein